MRLILLLNITFLFFSSFLQAQEYIKYVPEHMKVAKDSNGKKLVLISDLNNDGLNDNFVLVEDKLGYKTILALITVRGKLLPCAFELIFDYFDCCNALNVDTNKVVRISSNGTNFFEYYKFRWHSPANQFKILSYENKTLENMKGYTYKQIINFETGELKSTTIFNDSNTGDTTSHTETKLLEGVDEFTLRSFSSCNNLIDSLISR